jgi:protein-tyrosine phosphatase
VETLRGVAALVSRSLGSDASVYLHRQAGMNRSVLVAGLVPMHQGMTAEDAIERVRDRRQGSLSDEYADWLRQEGARADDEQGTQARR